MVISDWTNHDKYGQEWSGCNWLMIPAVMVYFYVLYTVLISSCLLSFWVFFWMPRTISWELRRKEFRYVLGKPSVLLLVDTHIRWFTEYIPRKSSSWITIYKRLDSHFSPSLIYRAYIYRFWRVSENILAITRHP